MSVRSTGIQGVFWLLVLTLIHLPLWGQGDEEQMVEYTAEEYQQYQQAVNAEMAVREEAILGFMRENPRSSLVQYAVGSYLQLMQDYQNKGEPQKVMSAGEKLLASHPDEANTLYMTAVAAYQLQKFEKATEYGEKVYAQKPNAGLAFILANSYGQLRNDDKYLHYGEKACQELAPKDCYQILAEITRIYASRGQWPKAAGYAQKAVEAVEAAEKPNQMGTREWKDYSDRQKAVAYAVMGRHAAETENWGATVAHYQRTLKLHSDPALNAESYYYLGMGRWKQKEFDSAMEAFAKGSVQKDAPHAKHCRQYLETLYKSTHNDSLAGLDEFVGRVTK